MAAPGEQDFSYRPFLDHSKKSFSLKKLECFGPELLALALPLLRVKRIQGPIRMIGPSYQSVEPIEGYGYS